MIAHRRIRQIALTVPPSPIITAAPGEAITTLSGQAIVTRLEQVGAETIAWADYGSGIEQPHTSEAISPHPKGTTFYQKRDGKPYRLMRASAEEVTLNWESELKGCTSSRFTWEEIDRLFTLTPPDESTQRSQTDPAGASNPRRRRRTKSVDRDDRASNAAQRQSNNGPADVLSAQGTATAEAGRQRESVSLESTKPPLEQFQYGDRIRAKHNRTGEWETGFVTCLGRTYAELDNKRCYVVLEGAELLQRDLLPDDLLEIVGRSWEEQVDRLLEGYRFYNLSSWNAKRSERVVDRHKGWEISFYNGSEVDITKTDRTWYAELRKFPDLKSNGDICAYAREAIDHVEFRLARLEGLLNPPLEQSCDNCQHQERHEAPEGKAYTCKLGHVIGSVMCSGVMAQSYPQFCKVHEAIVSVPQSSKFATVGDTDSPLEHQRSISPFLDSYIAEGEAIRAEATHDAIALLEQERDRLKAEGTIAPEGCWIETGKVKGRNFRQAWWRSSRPMFQPKRSRGNVEALVKSCYIGEEGGPEHKEAMPQKERRDRLKAIERQLQMLIEEMEGDR